MNNQVNIVINALLFQSVWWSAILNYPWLLYGAFFAMLLHYGIVVKSIGINGTVVSTIVFVIVISSLGISSDWLMMQLGMYGISTMPIWLILIWLAFCMTLTQSLRRLIAYGRLWVIACMIFGPMSYFAGDYYGRITVSDAFIWASIIQWFGFGVISYRLLHYWNIHTQGKKLNRHKIC